MYSKIYLRLEPLGLELVASAARGVGHDVRLIDLQAETHKDYFRWIRTWSPDAIVFSDAIPRTSVGKFLKSKLREQYADWKWE